MKEYFMNLKHNIWFVLSGLFFLILIFSREKLNIVICLLLALFIMICAFLKPNLLNEIRRNKAVGVICIALSITAMGLAAFFFVKRWGASSTLVSIIDSYGLTPNCLIFVISIVLGIISVTFFAVALIVIVKEIKCFFENNGFLLSPLQMLRNIRSNYLILFSGIVFFILNLQRDEYGYISCCISSFMLILLFSQISGLKERIKQASKLILFLSALSAVGICFYAYRNFKEYLGWNSIGITHLQKLDISSVLVYRIISTLLSLGAFLFVFVLCVLLIDYLATKLKPLFFELTKSEWIVYSVICIVFVAFSCVAFSNSNAFYDTHGATTDFDLIYTSDSLEIYKSNAFLRLYASQNDLKQPLFMLCSAPLTGIIYLFSVPLSHLSEWTSPALLNAQQICLMMVSFIMLSKCLRLSSIERICFILFCSLTYAVILFSFMIEQYIVTFFWLTMVVYLYCERKRADTVSIIGAGGAMVTNLVLLPCTLDTIDIRTPSKALMLIRKIELPVFAFVYLVVMLANCNTVFRTNYILTEISKFSASPSGIIGNVFMYSHFVSGCFIAPVASVKPSLFFGDMSWQLNEANTFNYFSLAILIIVLLGFIFTKQSKISRISVLWVCYSIVLLCIMGWGSYENGMILYALYFGWAYFILIFQFIKTIADMTKRRFVFPALIGALSIVLLSLNYKGIIDLMKFAFSYYPV